ncbi:MAG TPA: GYD domain-containing protein [Thermoanaerobaculaceae bacterium]|nr:GYD domain-containing protein [Thermoanaerobaculaceae bacterium]
MERKVTERGNAMATYVSLVRFTDQGIRNVKETTKRAKAFKEMAQKAGVKVREFYWTQGRFDIVTIMEASEEDAVAALFLGVGALGNVRTEMLRAHNVEEMEKILARIP